MTSEANRVLRNTFHVTVGFGVLAFQKAQVRRREIEAALKPQVQAVGRHLHLVSDGSAGESAGE
jgi:hypothetical protein